MKFKLTLALAALIALSGCASMKSAQNAYTTDFGGYLVAKSECKQKNFHQVKYKDSGGEDTEIRIAADCGDIEKPTHNGSNVAAQNSSYVQAGATLVATGLKVASDRRISDDNNETRVSIAELQNEREAAENAVLLEAIFAGSDQTEALVEQNVALTELIEALTPEDEEEEELDSEVPTDGI